MVFKIDASYFPLMHLNEFLVGNLAGLYFINSSLAKQNFDLLIIGIVMLIVVVLKYPLGFNFHNGLLALFFIPLIILLSLNDGIISVLFKSKICVFLGEISFGIYILQFVVWEYVSDYRLAKYFGIDKVEDFIFSFFLRLFILIFISSISYVYIETPIRNRIKRIPIH
jgi:peptidoglycan/LPS O-acetylase OafA/YrhL